MILLDTNVVVAHLNGDATVTARLTSQIEEIAVPALVVAELDYGAKASARPAENLARLSTFLGCVEIVPFDEAAAHQYGTLRARLKSIGKPTGEIDALIAAIALAHSSVLVTHNTRDFENIDGLALEDWLA
jgi:tRNA(fMet)-specific endonuclease VapC